MGCLVLRHRQQACERQRKEEGVLGGFDSTLDDLGGRLVCGGVPGRWRLAEGGEADRYGADLVGRQRLGSGTLSSEGFQ